MYALLYGVIILLAVAAASLPPLEYCIRSAGRKSSPKGPTASVVHQFALGAIVKGIVVRKNGKLLVTRLDVPELWEIDPKAKSASLIHRFSDATGLTGVTELEHDMFVLIAATLNGPPAAQGAFCVWMVDLRKGQVEVSKIAAFPEACFLHGVTTLNPQRHTVLVTDSAAGCVHRLDTKTGKRTKLLDCASMKVCPNERPMGISGIRVNDGYAYFTNVSQRTFNRIKIDTKSGTPIEAPETIAEMVLGDDFILGEDGDAYLAGNVMNVVYKICLQDGETEILIGDKNCTTIAGATSVAFGRTKGDSKTLYVATSGGLYAPVNGYHVEGGKVIAVTPNCQ